MSFSPNNPAHLAKFRFQRIENSRIPSIFFLTFKMPGFPSSASINCIAFIRWYMYSCARPGWPGWLLVPASCQSMRKRNRKSSRLLKIAIVLGCLDITITTRIHHNWQTTKSNSRKNTKYVCNRYNAVLFNLNMIIFSVISMLIQIVMFLKSRTISLVVIL